VDEAAGVLRPHRSYHCENIPLDIEIPISQGVIGRTAADGKPRRIVNAAQATGYLAVFPGMRSELAVPLKIGERVIGVVNTESREVDAYNADDERLLSTLAGQVATAIEHLRASVAERRRMVEMEAVNRVSTALRAAHTVEEMLPIMLDETLDLLKAEVGAVWLYNAAEGILSPTIARGWQSTLPHARLSPGEGIIGHTFSLNDVYVTADYHADPHLYAKNKEHIPTGWGGVCVPLRTFDQTLGVYIISVPLPRKLTQGEINLLTTISEISSNAIRRAALHEQTENQVQQLSALREIDRAISSSFDLRVTLNIVLNQILTQLKVDAASVLLFNPHMQTLEYTAGRGFRTEALQRTHLRLGEGFAGRAALERKLIYIPDLRERKTDFLRSPYFLAEGFVAYYSVPLIAKGQVKGVLEVFHRAPLASGPNWVSLLETLAGQVAIAIDNTQLFDYLQRSNADLAVAYDATIEGWSHALDLRDKETEGHSQRVTEMTMQLARSLGIGEAELVHVRRGALLHDIGKMGVSDSILLKPDKLTDEEWVLMRKHPQLAFNMLAPITYLKPALDIPYCHHEKWDGTGYPRGLKGEQIPLAARIFAVVDVYDALTSDRPYRKAWSNVKALEYIRELASKHFDPKVVESFLQVVNEDI
jgi:putative nucleotidyltransferase with HDIG domain